MATANLFIYNETTNVVNLSSTSQNMKATLPSKFSVQAGKPFNDNIQTIDQTSYFTLTVDAAHVLKTSYDGTNFNITPSNFDDGKVGALVTPVTLAGNTLNVLNYLIGDGEPVAYLNGLLSALVPPAVAELNKKGPYSATISGFTLELDTLNLSADNVSCTYASRQGTGKSSFNMQAIINFNTVSAAGKISGTATNFSTTNASLLVTFEANADPSNPSLQVQTLVVALPNKLDISALFPIPGASIAQALNSTPENEKLIAALNAKLSGGLGGSTSVAVTESITTDGEDYGWTGPIVALLEQYRAE